jgi:hypothetical protein
MKRVLLTTILAIAVSGIFAQDVKKTKEFITANAWDKAKTSSDATLAVPKNQKSAEAWYLKGKVYSACAANPGFKSLVGPDGRMQALDAFKKSMEIDKTLATTFLTLDQYQPVFTLYTTNFEEAAALYNGEKYTEALQEFKNCGVYGDYIFSNGWGLYKLDTTLTYYTALSALNSKNEEEAVKYFTKLGDARVGSTPEQATIYRYLAKYYYDKKDYANMSKYIKTGMELYPNDEYLPLLDLDVIREKGDKAALYKKFDEMVAANPNNFDVLFEYGNELFLETHVADASKRPANYNENCAKIEDLYKRAIALKPENMDAQLALGKHYYNMALFLDEDVNKIKGTKPEDVKKKADLTAQVAEIASKSIEPLEKVFNSYDGQGKLKTHDKSNYKSACSLLNYAYDKKKDKAKADFYQKKYDDADKNH